LSYFIKTSYMMMTHAHSKLQFIIACILILASSVRSSPYEKRDTSVLVKNKFGDFRENCFPRGSGHGCVCKVTDASGSEENIQFNDDNQCRKPVEIETAENKKKLNEEFTQKHGGLKENCFPRVTGCVCTDKDAVGNEVQKRYESDADCKALTRKRRDTTDPIREQAQKNYAAVLDELNNKFKGLKEGCYPRPKGCLCVIGKDSEGRDITDRRKNDADCKCKPGERSRDCPAQGA